jgi:predicted Zn finger-like uncharacterized protein
MVLATRCPHCRTTFRVVQDQLKLRGGLVRCGACKEIFNGAENLLRPVQPPEAAQRGEAASAADAAPLPAPAAPRQEAPAQPAQEPAAPASPAPAEPAAPPQPDPLLRMTLMDFSHAHEDEDEDQPEPAPGAGPDAALSEPAPETGPAAPTEPPAASPISRFGPPTAPAPDFALPRMPAQRAPAPPAAEEDELGRAIDELKRKPWRGTLFKPRPDEDAIDALDSNEPQFIAHAERRERRNRKLDAALMAGSALLALMLAFQMLYTWRVELASSLPGLAPLLKRGCAVFGCRVGLPARIDQVTIESSELQALPNAADTFALVALLRNRSSAAQQWPDLELTLNDADERAIARRVFTPRDYLPPGQDPAEGFAPTSEQSLKLVFSLSQLKASGYRVYLFYP